MSLSTKDVIECLEINFSIIFNFLFSVNIVIKMIIPLISILITESRNTCIFFYTLFSYFGFDYLCETLKIILQQPFCCSLLFLIQVLSQTA